MYMQEGGAEIVSMRVRPALVATLAIAAIGTVLIGLYPEPYIGAAARAYASALGSAPIASAR